MASGLLLLLLFLRPLLVRLLLLLLMFLLLLFLLHIPLSSPLLLPLLLFSYTCLSFEFFSDVWKPRAFNRFNSLWDASVHACTHRFSKTRFISVAISALVFYVPLHPSADRDCLYPHSHAPGIQRDYDVHAHAATVPRSHL